MDGVYQEYGNYFYVPMTQAYSLAVPVTVGCSWDRCLFCDLNHDHAFRIFSLEEIRAKLVRLKDSQPAGRRGRPVSRVVLAGGNPFVLPAETLKQIIALIREYFPQVTNISSFARADDILRKSPQELTELKALGMGELSVGIESGSDRILAFQEKGVSRDDNARALTLLEEAGLSYSTYVMLGLGGRSLSRENAIETGRFLSAFDPQVITVVSLVLFQDAPLVDRVKRGDFTRLRPLEYILEEKLLLENLSMRDTIFNATHKTNHLILKGRLPEHKEKMLEVIARCLKEHQAEDFSLLKKDKWRRWSLE